MRLNIIIFLCSLAIALLTGPIYIPLLKLLKFGQNVRNDGPLTHLKKQGTPTIGGLIFLTPLTVVCVYLYLTSRATEILPLLLVTIGFGFVGFLDDIIKIVKKRKDGLYWYQKMVLLFVVAIGFMYYIVNYAGISSMVYVDFFTIQAEINMGWLYLPFGVFVLLAMTNSVNLSDGLDGLCAGTSLIVFAFYALASLLIFDNSNVMMFSLSMLGALLGFLFFNYNPARVFMGDTGSLALGGAMGACALMLQRPLMLILIGLLYVIEALSVILQVLYFKITHGKRLLRMAPIHHHFELCGWHERKVVAVFCFCTIGMCVLTYFGIK